ncbi:DUF72 domain-containing protein [Sphingomonas sp. R-74633]|uniref:DUF72 domain-containing protein n=1 Tax=Sphingomonas sp. R-74633 TaxID=2751188 RepID=UPI0015D3792C|nr:DUF72 domain-containing protein [Sphingomonas sp. R-74633]NYT42034.1 DUF72 domain-containing protein [Sphingomonas sp. R-74633]
MIFRIGTAAWALPRDVRDRFPPGASNLARYAGCLNATEINSSFYRPHRRATYERWAASVPEGFRFAVKLPKAITHEARFVDCEPLLTRFAEEIGGLGKKRGPVLVQLPPKFAFDAALADRFFAELNAIVGGAVALEPRHPSWFTSEVEALLIEHHVTRVAADPAPVPEAARPGGWPALAYFRLHGSPRIYWSSYDEEARARWLSRIRATEAEESWIIFDNTASGAATADALAFQKGTGPVGLQSTGPG